MVELFDSVQTRQTMQAVEYRLSDNALASFGHQLERDSKPDTLARGLPTSFLLAVFHNALQTLMVKSRFVRE